MSIAPDPFPPSPGGSVYDLPRARDWQDRPEFQDLCNWWKNGGAGICSLVGFGGAGKTAIVERFLRVLPGGYPEHPKIPKDRSLAAPTRSFVFSFYKANPDTFFTELVAWLEGRRLSYIVVAETTADGISHPLSYPQAWDLLTTAGRCLLVLDGLEKVQDNGSRGIFGQILDRRLRDFVLRVANGLLPQVSLVITSRFRLFDPVAESADCYESIDVDKLQPSTAVQLFRARGVRLGTDEQLEVIARDLGFHALSIDLVGGYITLFCEGDPQRFSSLPPMEEESGKNSDPALDPRIAALRKQDQKFARLAERYHQTLAENDSTILALLQCICLFRLGVKAEDLISIFTGKGKESIVDPGLANLSEQQVQSKLKLLVSMRLVEASQPQVPIQTSQLYTVHPAVREGFLNKMDADATLRRHDAVGKRLNQLLGWHPYNPSDKATLDTLEEIIYHNVAAGHNQDAFDIYIFRIGGYRNLGWRLSDYVRGERICRMFIPRLPSQVAPLPEGLSKKDQALFLVERALYLKDLGQLPVAAGCYEAALKIHTENEEWYDASVENQILAEIFLTGGRLRAGLAVAENALRAAELASDPERKWYSHAILAQARAYRGEISAALSNFNDSRHWQHEVVRQPNRPLLLGMPGIQYALIIAWLGRVGEAVRLAEANRLLYDEEYGPDNSLKPILTLLLADLNRQQGNLTSSRELLHEAYKWALDRDAKEQICCADLVRAKIELAAFSDDNSSESADTAFARVASAVENGLRVARECKFGIFYIDLLLVRARLALYKGQAAEAEQDVRAALNHGVQPSVESGLPELPAATDPDCNYAWGIAEGRQLLAEALLLQAAQRLGHAEFIPGRFDRLPDEVRDLVDRGREQLDQALECWCRLRDPESEAEINPRGERTKRVLKQLGGGVLTDYPIVSRTRLSQVSTHEVASQELTSMAMASVFISYAHADNLPDDPPSKRWLDRFLMHLTPLVRQGDLAVWSDQQLKIGDQWEPEIQRQLGAAKVAVLLVSSAFLNSKYIANSELPVLLRRAHEDGLKILPILISPSLFHRIRFKWPDPKKGPEEFTLASLQAAGEPSKTLSEMTPPEQDRIFVELADRILEILDLP